MSNRIAKLGIAAGLFGGGEASVPATVTITSAASVITAASPFSITVTFSKNVTEFAAGDITVGNGAAGNLAGSGAVYTADITPTAAGTVTVDIGADVVAEGNTAATQFSILSTKGAVGWYDFSDLANLFQDTALTTPVTADGQTLYAKDKSGTNHLNAGTPGVWKANIVGSKGALLMTAASSQYYLAAAANINNATYTVITADQTTLGSASVLWGMSGASTAMANQSSATVLSLAANNITHNAITYGDPHIWMVTYNTATTTGKVKHDGYATWAENTGVTSYTATVHVHFARRESGPFWGGYGFERFVFPGVLSDAVINQFRDYLNTKWGEVFF